MERFVTVSSKNVCNGFRNPTIILRWLRSFLTQIRCLTQVARNYTITTFLKLRLQDKICTVATQSQTLLFVNILESWQTRVSSVGMDCVIRVVFEVTQQRSHRKLNGSRRVTDTKHRLGHSSVSSNHQHHCLRFPRLH